MSLSEILGIIQSSGTIPCDWVIHIKVKDEIYGVSFLTNSLPRFYYLWRQGNGIPENGEFIYSLEINQISTGKLWLINLPKEYTFVELMIEISKII